MRSSIPSQLGGAGIHSVEDRDTADGVSANLINEKYNTSPGQDW
jgi:hypothetical protein